MKDLSLKKLSSLQPKPEEVVEHIEVKNKYISKYSRTYNLIQEIKNKKVKGYVLTAKNVYSFADGGSKVVRLEPYSKGNRIYNIYVLSEGYYIITSLYRYANHSMVYINGKSNLLYYICNINTIFEYPDENNVVRRLSPTPEFIG